MHFLLLEAGNVAGFVCQINEGIFVLNRLVGYLVDAINLSLSKGIK